MKIDKLLFNIFNNCSFITDEVAKELSSIFENKKYRKNENLLCQGDFWDKVFVIKSGIVRLYFVTLEGQDFNKNFFSTNSIIWPVTSLLRDKESLFYISALENTEILYTSIHKFKEILQKYNILEKFTLLSCESLVNDKITREYSFLMNDAKNRYLEFIEKNKHIAEQIPDYHLASYLGISSVSLSRIKKQIKS